MLKPIILILCLVGIAFGAKYKGRDIDGRKYEATVKGNGVVSPARVLFDGRFVEIRFDNQTVNAKLTSEEIDNPHDIEASDGSHTWRIDVTGLD